MLIRKGIREQGAQTGMGKVNRCNETLIGKVWRRYVDRCVDRCVGESIRRKQV